MSSRDETGSPARPVSWGKLTIGVLVLAVAAAYAAFDGIAARASNDARLRARVESNTAPTVSIVVPKPMISNVAPSLELPGRLEAYTRAPIYARVAGYLKRWYVDIGGSVKAGQLLAEIDTPELDQQLAQAQAELGSAKANAALSESTAERWESLRDQKFVSSQAVEEKKGDLAVKRAIVNASQANLERLTALKSFARIVAPFDGIITARSTDVGALVVAGGAPGTELFVLSDISRVRLYVNVPQNKVTHIQQGDKASFTVPERPGKPFNATVHSMAQAIVSGSGSMLIQLLADNREGRLLPGAFARVSFEMPKDTGNLVVPPSTLIFGSAGVRVATLDADDRVVIRPVTIARDFGNAVELGSGLTPDARVIVSPPDGIGNGDKVRVRSAPAAASQARPPQAPVSR